MKVFASEDTNPTWVLHLKVRSISPIEHNATYFHVILYLNPKKMQCAYACTSTRSKVVTSGRRFTRYKVQTKLKESKIKRPEVQMFVDELNAGVSVF